MTLSVKFCGAAGTVTGSCYWLRFNDRQILVDCGMFQGSKTMKSLNYEDFPFDPHRIDLVLLTHAHIDHSGLVPKLIRGGFAGPVYATEGARDLLAFMLPDSGYIQESEVRALNRRNEQRGLPTVAPIYTQADGEAATEQFRIVDYEVWRELGDGLRARYWNAGHILGSASIELEVADAAQPARPLRLLFSGDIGPDHKLFHPDPAAPSDLDYVFCESTYGDRSRESVTPAKRRERLGAVINTALTVRKGVLVVPAFSVERTQELLADISILMNEGAIGDPLVFLDSPLAIRATETFAAHAGDLEDVATHGDVFQNENFVFTRTVAESKNINHYKTGAIIIAASGMCEAGRIRHHLKRRLWDRTATVLITGFQAQGTLGALLLEGKEAVRIQGEDVRVRAHIEQLDLYSGHADADELEEWILERMPVRRAIFLTHGEEAALAGLKDRLQKAGIARERIIVPRLDDEFELRGDAFEKSRAGAAPRIDPQLLSRRDWHNDLAQLFLDIREAVETAADEKGRQKVIRRLRRALGDPD